jgi:predicted enzyme related to lactoylglutathione lyase
VASLDKSLAVVRERGGTVLLEPRSSGGGRYAVVKDPASAVCALYQSGD